MSGVIAGVLVIPGAVATMFLLVIGHLQRQLREPAFRLWELTWLCYVLHLTLLGFQFTLFPGNTFLFLARVFMVATAICLLASSRQRFDARWKLTKRELAIGCVLILWAALDLVLRPRMAGSPRLYPAYDLGVAAVFIYAAVRFYLEARRRNSFGYRLLSGSLAFWALLMCSRQFHTAFERMLPQAGHFLGPLPQTLAGISMLAVLYEYEWRQVQENTLALSVLSVDTSAPHPPETLVPALERLLDRVLRQVRADGALLLVREAHSGVLPSVQRGYSQELLSQLREGGVAELLCELTCRRGGILLLRMSAEQETSGAVKELTLQLRPWLQAVGDTAVTVVSLQSRNRDVGVLLIPHREPDFSTSQNRRLLTAATQIGITLDNYILMREERRRTNEYELLTHIGQVISSRLDPEEILEAVHTELGRLFDTSTFYIAFRDAEELRFEFEVVDGVHQPKRSRPFEKGFPEHIITTGQPVLINGGVEEAKTKLGVSNSEHEFHSFLGVAIPMAGHTSGAMAIVNRSGEHVFDERHLKVLQTAAGQVGIAMENALLFAEAEQRAQHMTFLNHISALAISSRDADAMLGEIVAEVHKNFEFEHVAIGILDYTTKNLEIKAESGTAGQQLGRRIPLGLGILGNVARTGETALVQDGIQAEHALFPGTRSVLCMPLIYSEMLLGVLNIESARNHAFPAQDELLLRTLADLVSTALHNALVFQKLEQQSITDPLTRIKTRRYFMESMQSEWKRASRTGRPFSVVLLDLDHFKAVNDGLGHLEGDLVLARVGGLLEQKCRHSNTVARYGGDEFVVLMPETGMEQALILSERLRLWIANDPVLNERKVTGSFGVATFPAHGSTVEQIIRMADAGMYLSKRGGGNCVSTADRVTEDDPGAAFRHKVSIYVEGFLQREHIGPEHAEEFVSNLKKLCAQAGEPATSEVVMEAIRTLNRAVEARDMNGATHGSSVAHCAQMIGRELCMSREELDRLVFAASVHDVGKVLLPEGILSKPSLLNEEEFDLVKQHSEVGAHIVQCMPGGDDLAMLVRHHHERMDGSGYPGGLRGEEIPFGARILAVADVYVNMTSERSFAPAMTSTQALRELEQHAGQKFDPVVVRALATYLRGEKTAASTTIH